MNDAKEMLARITALFDSGHAENAAVCQIMRAKCGGRRLVLATNERAIWIDLTKEVSELLGKELCPQRATRPEPSRN